MKSLKILYISKLNSYPPLYGEQVHVYNIVKELVNLGHEVYLCDYDKHPLAKKVSISDIDKLLNWIDILYIRQTLSHELDWTNKFIRFPRNYKIIWELNLPKYELKFAIDHLYNYKSRNFLGEIKKRVLCNIQKRKVDFLWNKKKKIAQNIDGIVTVSNILANYLTKEFSVPVATIPNGADCRDLFTDFSDTLHILIAGSKLPWIDWDTPIKVIERLKDNKNIVFHIVDYNLKYTFNNIKYYNRMSQSDLKQLISKIHVGFVLYNKYDWCPIGFYNSPLKLFEYMGSCKVVIATNMGQISEIVQHKVNGLLVKPQDYKDICDSIKFLLCNPKEYKTLAHNAYNTIRKSYSWKHSAQKTVDFIKRL